MCSKIFVVGKNGPDWIDTPTIEGSLGTAQDNIGEYVQHIEDVAKIAKKNPRVFGRFAELLAQIDLTLIRIDVESKKDKSPITQDWLNNLWTLKPEEQRILLKKIGIVVK